MKIFVVDLSAVMNVRISVILLFLISLAIYGCKKEPAGEWNPGDPINPFVGNYHVSGSYFTWSDVGPPDSGMVNDTITVTVDSASNLIINGQTYVYTPNYLGPAYYYFLGGQQNGPHGTTFSVSFNRPFKDSIFYGYQFNGTYGGESEHWHGIKIH